MTQPIDQALALWGMQAAKARLVAQRENSVWRVDDQGAAFALRFHRPGYRSKAELNSELQWMAHLAEGGVLLPCPIPLPDGPLIAEVSGHHVSVLTWLDGRPIGASGNLDGISDPEQLAFALGQQMTQMHDLTDAWTLPAGFSRPDWRREGLLGDAPLWGAFWQHPHLKTVQRALLLRARDAAFDALTEIEQDADQGLIHADLLAENIMIHEGQLSFIDFDDCAWGFRDFELATFLLKFLDQPYYPALRQGLCAGYTTRRPVDGRQLDIFLLLRALTYVGWIIDRVDEPGGAARSQRMLSQALTLANDFLKGRA